VDFLYDGKDNRKKPTSLKIFGRNNFIPKASHRKKKHRFANNFPQVILHKKRERMIFLTYPDE